MDIESNKNVDKSIVKTDLAEEYLENNKIQEIPKSKPATVSYNLLFIKLAKKIAENEELFCQLEFLKRKSPADDVLNNLKLIEQNLLHRHQTFDISKKRLAATVNMYDETPLAPLGLVAQNIIYKRDTTIVATQQASAACYLFTQLCHEVGLGEVSLLLRKEKENIIFETERYFETPWKSTGVITGNSDIELAAAAFVTSSSTCFWKLQRILVQESMFEAFKKALATLVKPSNQFEALNRGSTELVMTDNKMFWINVLEQENAVRVLCGEQAASPHIIFVKAYRNVPELLSLLTDYMPKVVSLWTSDIAEANDITHGITSSLVWVNTFGNFDGPPALSQWFYTDISIFHFCAIKVCSVDENIGSLVQPWKSYDMEKRLNLIYQVLEMYRQKDESNDILKLQESISQFRIDQSVYCYKGSIVIILELPSDMVYYYRRPCQSYEDLKGVIQLLVKGDALLVDCAEPVLGLMRALRDAGVPVFWASAGDAGRLYIRHDFINRKRAIQINFKSTKTKALIPKKI